LCRTHTHRQQALKSTQESNANFRSPHHYMCPHTTCVLILLYTSLHTVVYESNAKFWSPHLILLYMCPHTTICVSSYCYMCVLILLYVCPHTAVCVSSYCCVCVLLLLCMRPHTGIYVSSYCYMSIILKLLCMCPPAIYLSTYYCAIYLSSYYYMCPHTTYASSGVHRNGRHASCYACAAIHTCGPLLSTLRLQAAIWGGAVRHVWRVPSMCLPCFHDDPQKAKIPKRVSSLTHSPPQVC
jgi:hypothetical protein